MANERYTRTNQKLYFAGLALNNWRKAEQGHAFDAQGLVQAEREAALFHLYGALLGLCHEIADYYRLPSMNAGRVEAVLTREAVETAPTPELAELYELATQGQTWLGQLLQAYNGLFSPPAAPNKPRHAGSLIEAVSVDDDEQLSLQCEQLEEWRQNLKRMALRFRQALTEC
jgi:hypothetical protein